MTYEDQIEKLLNNHLTKNDTPSLPDLAQALGCATHYFKLGWGSVAPTKVQPPEPAHEPLIVQTLLTALRHHVGSRNDDSNGESILNGLLQKQRWRACLETLDDAHHFVFVVACSYCHFECGITLNSSNELQAENIVPLREMLVEWMGVSATEAENMTMMGFLRLAFGHMWCDIALGDNMPLWEIQPILYEMRPIFTAGLISAYPASVPCELPCELPDIEPACI